MYMYLYITREITIKKIVNFKKYIDYIHMVPKKMTHTHTCTRKSSHLSCL